MVEYPIDGSVGQCQRLIDILLMCFLVLGVMPGVLDILYCCETRLAFFLSAKTVYIELKFAVEGFSSTLRLLCLHASVGLMTCTALFDGNFFRVVMSYQFVYFAAVRTGCNSGDGFRVYTCFHSEYLVVET